MKKIYLSLLTAAVAATPAFAAPMLKGAPNRLVNVTPNVLPATDITETGFTANWESVAGAEGYAVFCYEPIQVTESGEYNVLEESFNLVNQGSTVEPVWHEGFSCTLDTDYDYTFTPDWTVVGAAFARGMVSGNLYTPYVDLTNNGGHYRLEMDVIAQGGTKFSVRSVGTTEETQTYVCTETGWQTVSFEFSNGSHDTYLYIVDEGIVGDDDGEYANVLSWFDNVRFVQNLQAGDTFLRLVALKDGVNAPDTSVRFDDMKFLYEATHLCYDLYAAYFYYDDPDDPWNYDVDYSKYSALQHLTLLSTGVSDIINEAVPVTVFDLQGRFVGRSTEGLDEGIYIVRQGDKSRKIMVK